MRNHSIDFVRSIAIIIMLSANAAPYIIAPSSPFEFRLICSLAAPLFTFLSGYTFAMHASKTNGLKSGIFVLCSALIVDCLAWNIPPFQTFDVLYVIALGQIVLHVVKRIPNWITVLICLVLLIVPTILGTVYRFPIQDPAWSTFYFQFYRMFFDGWFPVFPWLAFPILGYLMHEWQALSSPLQLNRILNIGSIFLIIGIILSYFYKADQAFRDHYVEIFYPANLIFQSLAIPFCVVLILASSKMRSIYENKLIQSCLMLGRHSMFVYIMHAFLISWIISNFEPNGILLIFLVLIPFYALIFILTYVLELSLQSNWMQAIPRWIRKPMGLY